MPSKKANLAEVTKSIRKAEPYINIIYVLIGSVAMFGIIGWFLDKKMNTTPGLFITGLFLGLFAGYYHMYKVLKKLENNSK
jgi:F0F1-type ATP synthase assembly protein I